MLRQPSTPWITYDRASRASNLAEVLPRRASIVEAGTLVAVPLAAPEVPRAMAEPSGVAVATDIEPPPGSQAARAAVLHDGALASRSRARWSPLSIAVVAAGMTLSAGLLVAASMYEAEGRAAAAAPPRTATAAVDTLAVAPPEPTPTDLAAALGEASLAKPSTARAATGEDTKDGVHDRPRFGRLTIRGAAKHKDVYFDGLRMLGSGKRSFRVLCGPHTISINQRHGGRDVEVPCNGELVVDR